MIKLNKFTVLSFLSFLFISCGGTTVKVKQSSDGVNATVSVQTNNPTSVDVKPSVEVKLDDLNELLKLSSDSLSWSDDGELTLSVKQIKDIADNYSQLNF